MVSSDLKQVGHVTMNSDDWEAIERACVWSTRGNLMGVPTDCPQRDVREEWFMIAASLFAVCGD